MRTICSYSFFIFLIIIVGCSKKKQLEIIHVKGKILLRGGDGTTSPMNGARIVFNPISNEDLFSVFPAATANQDGSFQIGTLAKEDGAPEGDYIVTIQWKEKVVPQHDVFGKGPMDHGPDLLNDAYSNRSRSPLKVKINKGQDLEILVPAP